MGVKGMRLAARELPGWPRYFNERELRLNLFQIYVFIEIGGTGGGSFRPMYSRFLREAAAVTGREGIASAADSFELSGKLFIEIALLFKEAEKIADLRERIGLAAEKYERIAELEERTFRELENMVG